MRQQKKLEALWLAVATCAVPALLGAKGCFFGGEVLLGENDGGLGGEATGGKAGTSGGKASLGGKTGTGGLPAASTGGSGAQSGSALPMDKSGWISQDSNPWGIQGRWYWFSDQVDGGVTAYEDVTVGKAPFVPGKGMCVHGTSGPGDADNYTTWGGGIGVNLNYDVANDAPIPLVDPPRCFTIVINANAMYPSELRAEPLGLVPPGGQPLFTMLHPGTNEVCLDQVQVSTHCSADLPCLRPESLANGVATLNITATCASFTAGAVDFCVESITPHD
jgi:hypothetical protein